MAPGQGNLLFLARPVSYGNLLILTKVASTNRPCLRPCPRNIFGKSSYESVSLEPNLQPRLRIKMHILNFLRLLVLLLLPASISAAVVDRIVYTPGHSGDLNSTSPNLVRRDTIHWGSDDESQDACDSDATPEKTDGSEFLKLDCVEIIKFNQRFGRYTISGYTDGKWAKINIRNTCAIAVARKDDSTNDFE